MRTIGLIASFLLLSGAATGGAQSMAEAAKREEKRRAEIPKTETKSYSNEDLQGSGPRETSAEPEAAADATSARAGSRSSTTATSTGESITAASGGERGGPEGWTAAREEAYWRERAELARRRVANAEERVASLERWQPRTNPGAPACAESNLAPDGRLTEENYRVCDHTAPGSGSGYAKLQKAREELVRAKAALEELKREARRAGAQPGWLR